MSSCRYLVINGVVSPTSDVPPVSSFLENHPGAYTTSRTHNNASILLFWQRHLRRLADSARILYESRPELLFGPQITKFSKSPSSSSSSLWESTIPALVNNSLRKAMSISMKERKNGEELAVTTLVSGNPNKCNVDEIDEEARDLDVYVHLGIYIPPAFGRRENGARLAVVGRGRDVARAKFSDWVKLRKSLEKLRPPLVTELLLSNDGDRILEGCITNFFVVCRRESNGAAEEIMGDHRSTHSFEVQTAPINDGLLPGVVRQLVLEICSRRGIPFREVAPSWSNRELWEEAFITSSLRLVQHVQTIRAPSSWELLESQTWKELAWEEKQFEETAGVITAEIQGELMGLAGTEGFPTSYLI
ncbi:hypothetical protein NE237_008757 [Protea cynaroides]|uniref:Class IV aminotransferase n=1 Tax=Protea cynaroides TaxID=273540 RepID=A0A9Q0KW66_9MAGN|nr:hypothetical protein NE237_008757 [Protea cynaroides]